MPKTVTIFGGGIAGLTVAHELAVRGFDVTVVEEQQDTSVADESQCGVGGMARTQNAAINAPLGPVSQPPFLDAAKFRFPPSPRIQFEPKRSDLSPEAREAVVLFAKVTVHGRPRAVGAVGPFRTV
jgi:glycine/D-amino acid oxidase-like deaminating enzyme